MATALGSTVGAAIALERERRGWSAANLAGRVPCDREQVRQWEAGTIPTLPNLYALAMAFGCSVYDLIPPVRDVLTWRSEISPRGP